MSISTNIDGSVGNGEANQVFNLLAVVANPDVYAEKIKTLLATIEENKKFLALVGPAGEILDIREKVAKDKAQSEAELAEARAKAAKIQSDAEALQRKLITEARAEADRILAEVNAVKNAAEKSKQESSAKEKFLNGREQTLNSFAASLTSKETSLEIALAQARQAAEEAAKAKEVIVKKHKAFLESL